MTRLSAEQLRVEQDKTLAAPPIKYGLLAKILFVVMDLFYGRKRSWNKFKVLEIIARVPYQAWEHVAFFYYHISWLLYVIKPSWSYHLNVEFEDHAEREYMLFAKEHPELEAEPFESDFKKDYGDFPHMADVIRQISYDERMHKEESMMKMGMARFA